MRSISSRSASRNPASISAIASSVAAVLMLGASANADTLTWKPAGVDTLWSNPNNWTTTGANTVPTSADAVVFPSVTPAPISPAPPYAFAPSVDVASSALSLSFSNNSGTTNPAVLSGPGVLTLYGNITKTGAGTAATVSTPVALGADSVWSLGSSGATLTLNTGAVTGNGFDLTLSTTAGGSSSFAFTKPVSGLGDLFIFQNSTSTTGNGGVMNSNGVINGVDNVTVTRSTGVGIGSTLVQNTITGNGSGIFSVSNASGSAGNAAVTISAAISGFSTLTVGNSATNATNTSNVGVTGNLTGLSTINLTNDNANTGTLGLTGNTISGTGTLSINADGTKFSTVSKAITNYSAIALGGEGLGNNTMSSAITNAVVGRSVSKSGGGTWVLSNASNTYDGNTTITGGALKLAAAANNIASSPNIIVGSLPAENGAKLDVTAITGGFTLAGLQTLSGHGTVVGNVTTADTSHLSPGNSIGTTTFENNLSVVAGTILDLELGNPASDLIAVTGGLTIDTSNIQVNLSNVAEGDYKLFTYASLTAAAGAGFNASFVVLNADPNYTFTFSNTGAGPGQVDLNITEVPEPTSLALLAMGGLTLLRRRRR